MKNQTNSFHLLVIFAGKRGLSGRCYELWPAHTTDTILNIIHTTQLYLAVPIAFRRIINLHGCRASRTHT